MTEETGSLYQKETKRRQNVNAHYNNKITVVINRTYHYILEVEILLCVVVADVFNHLAHTLLFIALERYESVLYVLAYEVAESAAEVLMAWV